MGFQVTDQFRSDFRNVLLNTYMRGWANIPEDGIQDHIEHRFLMFRNHTVPWVDAVFPLYGSTWIEVGSGTGSSTLAFADAGATLHTFEISEPSILAARERHRLAGVGDRIVEHRELFDKHCSLYTSGNKVDGVLLLATLEHMTFPETQEIMKCSWDILRPGGVLVISDTPNRLCSMDFHTSFLPFFQMLPPHVRSEYAKYAPREDFAKLFSDHDLKNRDEALTRWGNGVSYHEFELALGPNIHYNIIASGYEDIITRRWPINFEDTVLQMLFKYYNMKQHIAFARHNLMMIIRKD